jgi:outer membrane protein OmpA-like peptidoglycan-associated protein
MNNKLVMVVVVGILIGGLARADESTHASGQETIGVGSGAVIGAVAGGPVGSIFGAAFGGWLGDQFFQRTDERDQYKTELTSTQTELATVGTELRSVEQELMLSAERAQDEQARWIETLARSVNVSVSFRTGDAGVDEQTAQRIEQLAGLIIELGPVVVDVEGHADARGAEEFNEQLSAERAAAVRDILIRGGVDAGSISAVAMGETLAGGEDADIDQHALDRRVEIRLNVSHTDRLARSD